MIKRTSGQAQMLLGFLVVLAFFAQSLIPAGYMPDLKSGSVFEMVICHGAQQSVILVDENMQPVSSGDTGHHKTDHSKPCVFASVSAKHLAFQSFLFARIEHLIYEAYVDRDAGLVFSTIITRPYFGQGPPVILS